MKSIVLLCGILLTGQIAHAQDTANTAVSEVTTKQLEALLNDTDLNKVKIEAKNLKEATQLLCDEICKKLAVKDEPKIVINIKVPPVDDSKVNFSAKYLNAHKLLKKFAQDNQLFMSLERGVIVFTPNFTAPERVAKVNALKAIKLKHTKVTAEYLPTTLRNLLKPHGLTFTLHNKKVKLANKPKPIYLNKVRISRFSMKDSNMFDVLSRLADSVNLDLWVTAQGLTFTPKGSDFSTIIRCSSLKK